MTGLHFTYPPFAALVMVPPALLPAWLADALWTGASVGALAAVVALVRRSLGRPAPGWLVALLTLGALALEPVWQNLTFGQVNVFLMLAVLVDLLRPERRWSGVLVGIAAGVKLTPLVFVVLLVLVGRRAAAGRAMLAFAGTVAAGFAVAPASAATYWTDRLVDAGRVGPPALAHNQSVYGALTRLLDGPPPTLLWLTVAGLLSLRGAGRRRRLVASRRPVARHLPGSDGDADRLARLVVAPLGVGGAGRPAAVGAQPVGAPSRGRRCSWPARSCGCPTATPASTGGARSTTSSATPTCSPPWHSRPGPRSPSSAGAPHRHGRRLAAGHCVAAMA